MDKKDYLKQNKIILYIIFAIIFSYVIYNLSAVLSVLKSILSLFMPLFIAIIIAFIANIPMRRIENGLFALQKKIGKHQFKDSTIRAFAMAITLILFLLIIVLFSSFIIPRIAESIDMIIKNLDSYITRLTNFINRNAKRFHINYHVSRNEINSMFSSINVAGILSRLLGVVSDESSNTTTVINSISSTALTAVTAFFMSLYLLANKERHIVQLRKLVLYCLGKDRSVKLFQLASEANHYFNSFVSGQVLEALIFMLETYAVMRIFAFPFPELIATAAFIFAFVPMFGGFFTCFIGIVLVAAAKSESTILFIVVFICLQQFEGNFVYPKIVGKSVGISGLFVLLGISVFGGLFGFFGVLIAVPLTALIYAISSRIINIKLYRHHIEVTEKNVVELDNEGKKKGVLY